MATETKQGRKLDERQDWLEKDDAKHQLCRDLREGVEAMRSAARQGRYMKPNPGELEPVMQDGVAVAGMFTLAPYAVEGLGKWTRYDLRLERSDLPNPWADTIRDTARLPFRARISLEGWAPELMGTDTERGWVANMDGEGRSIDEWAQNAFEDALFGEGVYQFVDNDPRSFESRGARVQAKARPWVTKLLRRDFNRIIWQIDESGAPRLQQIVFRQVQRKVDIADPANWSDETVPTIKIVTAGDPQAPAGAPERRVTWQTFQEDSDGKWSPMDAGVITPDQGEMVDIPLVFLPARRIGPWRDESPYRSTAPTQVALWLHNSEVAGLAREVTQSVWYESQGTPEPGARGGKQKLSDTNNSRYIFGPGQLALVESTGKPLEAVLGLIDRKAQQIRDAHHDINTRRPTEVTATQTTLEGVHANSFLEQVLIQHEDGWRAVLELMALLDGQPQRGTVSIPHDFGLPSQGIERNQALYLAGKMDARNFWPEKVRHGDVDEKSFQIELEVARDNEEKASAERARKRLEDDMGDALRTPDDDEADEAEEVPQA